MGNKSSINERHTTALFSAATPTGLPVKVRLSEEEYLPMTPAMRKRLLTGKRFQHVVPNRGGGGDAKKSEQPEEVKKSEMEKEGSSTMEADEKDENVLKKVENDGVKETAVDEEPSTGSQSQSLGALGMKGAEEQKHLYFMKSPAMTNRRYSLMDMRLSDTKSYFTMKLKDRLRQSKLELGFDEELLNWKEFVYKDNPGGRKSMERRVGFSTSHEILYDKNAAIEPTPVEVVDYCAHNCQILGLCGVKRTRVNMFPNPNSCSPVFPGDVIGSNNFRKLDKTHKKKDSCNCDVCTLAYLTDMGFPDHETGTEMAELSDGRNVPQEQSVEWLKSPGRDSVSVRWGKGDGSVRESVKVIDVDDPNKTVEVKIYNSRSSKLGKCTGNNTVIESSSRSSVSTSFEEDSTNLKIKRLFQQYGNNTHMHSKSRSRSHIGPVPDSHRSSYDGVSILNISTDQDYKISDRCHTQTPRTRGIRSPRRKRTDPLVTRYARKPSSSSVLGPSTSSSLSTIMSYKRVKQIFQTIIEKNRPRKRTKKNIHKFLEMEELGLGEVRNNRWYPSDSKTKAIWKDISSARGVQAQFRKCHYHNHRASRPEASRVP